MKLRDKIVGLPLQRSIFDRLECAGTLLGLDSALQDGRFQASLDGEGNLHVDQADAAALAAAFPEWPDHSFVVRLDTQRRSRCSALLQATAQAREATATEHVPAVYRAANDLLDRLADFVPYPLLTKIVPDLLREALLKQDASAVPSAPTPSPGMRLTIALERLAPWCWAHGSSPAILSDAWPHVPGDVEAAVRRFCATHAGFGPVAWEAPGFDDARYTLAAVAGLGHGAGASDEPDPPRFSPIVPDLDRLPMTLSGALEGWLELTDLQIWYIRNAFYLGLVPLLARIATELGLSPDRLLFVTRHELKESIPGNVEITERMATYWADIDYLEYNAVETQRLQSMFEEASWLSR